MNQKESGAMGLINFVLTCKHPLKGSPSWVHGGLKPFHVTTHPMLTAALGIPPGHLPISPMSNLEISISHWLGVT